MALLTRGDGVLPEGDADRLGQVQGQVGDPEEILEQQVQSGHCSSGGPNDNGDVVGVCPEQESEPSLLEAAEEQIDDCRKEQWRQRASLPDADLLVKPRPPLPPEAQDASAAVVQSADRC